MFQAEGTVSAKTLRSRLSASSATTTLAVCPSIVKTSFSLFFKTYLGARNTETTAVVLTD